MSNENRIIPPDGMMRAAEEAASPYGTITVDSVETVLKASLVWLSNNPIVPNKDEIETLLRESLQYWFAGSINLKHRAAESITEKLMRFFDESQRKAFVASEPSLKDDREMTVYDCLDCGRSWKQQLREPVSLCVYCRSANTRSILTASAVRRFGGTTIGQ